MSEGDTGSVKAGAGVLGVGAAACVACCAGPLLGALSAIGIASAVGYLAAGSVAIVVGVAAIAALLYRRRRRSPACDVAVSTVAAVDAPTRKPRARTTQ